MPDFMWKVSQSGLNIYFNVWFEIQMKHTADSC